MKLFLSFNAGQQCCQPLLDRLHRAGGKTQTGWTRHGESWLQPASCSRTQNLWLANIGSPSRFPSLTQLLRLPADPKRQDMAVPIFQCFILNKGATISLWPKPFCQERCLQGGIVKGHESVLGCARGCQGCGREEPGAF